ncbi:uncharacterized protein LOC131207677 [Anopheles bellator]|uniref:uncharacterized protein LOC131207677 n=1 Tax=Anopheles bellator TaxID=139047 RepID=UPI00264940A0|nr:uncharacterized protein LOC131207677 [Anopheles bellator]
MWSIVGYTLLFTVAHAKFVMEFNKVFKPCPRFASKPFAIDTSKMQIFLSDDDELTLNGELVFVNDLVAPVGLVFYTQKLEHGEWMPRPYGKQVLDMCAVITSPMELWYSITRHMNQTRCPFRKGHVERFDMVSLGTFGLDDFMEQMVGDWKIFAELTVRSPLLMDVSCAMCEVSVIEH